MIKMVAKFKGKRIVVKEISMRPNATKPQKAWIVIDEIGNRNELRVLTNELTDFELIQYD